MNIINEVHWRVRVTKGQEEGQRTRTLWAGAVALKTIGTEKEFSEEDYKLAKVICDKHNAQVIRLLAE